MTKENNQVDTLPANIQKSKRYTHLTKKKPSTEPKLIQFLHLVEQINQVQTKSKQTSFEILEPF